ncbi:hypothetical protein [Pseudotabrizicola algicola]|uniref:Uncharacterized protein n=1 Tax=Pseudotabrizicola algicola TaxID=2709381 RepID=A0A6B3RMG5_9RHOB|nr:hypothetical protein [Pseudotabrizicola algicola]NEX46386.1 hypothetical protein [Pseudotabrizicola algicola]
MTPKDRLRRLEKITLLLRERELSRLAQASAQKTRTEAQLMALDKTGAPHGLDPVVAAQVTDRFGLWTTNRRILLNQKLARETVAWMEAKTEAQRAFGRAEVLRKLCLKP